MMSLLKKYWALACLGLLIFAGTWVLVRPGFFHLHDFVHAARIAEFSRAWSEGHIPVRWSRNFGFGYGMPLFEFYAPLPYALGALFWSLGLPVVTVIKLLFLLVTIFGAIGVYKLSRSFFGYSGALIASAAVTLAPYRAVNLYIRGALSETFGMAAMPWVLWGIVLVVRRKAYGWLVLSLSLVVLFLSHNIMTLIFAPFAALFALALLFIERNKKRNVVKIIVEMAAGGIFATALSAFYLFPAFLEKSATQVEQLITEGYFHYSLHFLYIRQFFVENWGFGGSQWGPDDGISFFLGLGQLVAVLIAALALAKSARKWKKSADIWWLAGVFALLAGVSLLLSLKRTEALWNSVAISEFVQFPWRFMAIGGLFLGLLGGLGVNAISKKIVRRLVFLGLFVLLLTNARYFQPEQFLDDPSALYYTNEERIQANMSETLPDYIPADVSQELIQQTAPENLIECETCQVDEQLWVNQGHQRLVGMKQEETSRVSFNIAYFPGWIVEVDGVEVEVGPDEHGRLSAEVLEGDHAVGVRFGSTPVRAASDVVSGVAWLSLAVMGIVGIPQYLGKK